ncbi:MAG TPA: hypothetical protein DIW52_12495, partial [Pseudomonas sp.]|nr:hypothetical protein [Pseudomonas sp.]
MRHATDSTDELTADFLHDRKWLLSLFWTRISCGDAMEDIFVVKRCNKIIIHGRRAGETSHPPPD